MPAKQNESPVHPKALKLADIVPGRRVVSIIPALRAVDEMVVVSPAYPSLWTYGKTKFFELKVELLNLKTGEVSEYFAKDLGLMPCEGRWSKFNFLVAPEDAGEWNHLLDEPLPSWDSYQSPSSTRAS